jgi:hypothetical protein
LYHVFKTIAAQGDAETDVPGQPHHELAEFHAIGAAARVRVRQRPAARHQWLGTATVLVSIPTLFSLFSVIAFAIGVMIHGF